MSEASSLWSEALCFFFSFSEIFLFSLWNPKATSLYLDLSNLLPSSFKTFQSMKDINRPLKTYKRWGYTIHGSVTMLHMQPDSRHRSNLPIHIYCIKICFLTEAKMILRRIQKVPNFLRKNPLALKKAAINYMA